MENIENIQKNEKEMNQRQVIITIGLCFIMILFGLGLWSVKALWLKPVSSALGIDRSVYSVADTMRYIANALINIPFGYLVNKFGSKKLILAGFLCFIIAALCYALATGIVVLYIGGFILGFGFSWTGTAVIGYVVNRVCSKNKGTIMGLVLAANGVGGAIATEIINPLITSGPLGYKKAFYTMAAIFAAIFVLILIFYREPKGKAPLAKKKVRGESWTGIPFNTAVKKTYFYGACVCIFFTGFILQGVSSIYAANMSDLQIDSDFIAKVALIHSISLAFFKFFNGFMYDKLGLRITITIDATAACCVMIVLMFITNSLIGKILAIIYGVMSSVALPLETVMIPIYAKDLFGEKSFNKSLGIFASINQAGYACGAPLINKCYDLTGSYKIALTICAVVMFCVIIGLQFVISSANKVKKQVIEQEGQKQEA